MNRSTQLQTDVDPCRCSPVRRAEATAAGKISRVPTDAFLLSAARTPIGRYGGGLKSMHPAELGAVAARAAVERASLVT